MDFYSIYNILICRLDIYGDMRYNLRRIYKKITAVALAVLITCIVQAADCVALEAETEMPLREDRLLLDVSVSEGGGCIEVVLSASRSACGVLATLSYDPENFSFLTFARSDSLDEKVAISCSDSSGRLRILLDSEESFSGGTWCRFFFSINESALNEAEIGELFFEISVSVESAYERSGSGYDEIVLEGSGVRLDLSERSDQEQTNAGIADDISAGLIDLGAAFEKFCALCVSGFADEGSLAAGFEITVSCESIAESYTISRILPITEHGDQGYTAILLVPRRDSFYVTVRGILYSPSEVVRAEETYCFFVSGSMIERVGLDR